MNRLDSDHPGGPRLSRVREVKKALRRLGVTPIEGVWADAWEWANQYAQPSAYAIDRRLRWPSSENIASMYLFLLVHQLRLDPRVRLPYGAGGKLPPQIAEHLGVQRKMPLLEHHE